MPRTERMSVVEVDSDDDGAPEELNMFTGKDEAEKVRREERESRKRIVAAAKEKRKKASGPKEGKAKVKKEKAQASAGVAEELDADGEEEPQNQLRAPRAVIHGLLNESIVKYLAEQDKNLLETNDTQPEEVEPKKRKRKKMKGGDPSRGEESVVLLKFNQAKRSPFESALAFRQNHLYGEGIHRSLIMLPKRVE